ncbi:hypothetical protein J6590_073805 [Homalodisca vitripennis]|nr:hypothetical protein J6590_073805 [Homalodisca vitripennis]
MANDCSSLRKRGESHTAEATKRSKGQVILFFYWKTLCTNQRAEWRWGRGLRNLQSNTSKEYQAHRGWQENWMMLPSQLLRERAMGESDMT